MIPKLKGWLQIDFSLLRKPHLNYKSQMQIDPHQVCMANAAMAHFGLDPGRFIRWMGGEYTGQHQDTHSTLAAVKGHILADLGWEISSEFSGIPQLIRFWTI